MQSIEYKIVRKFNLKHTYIYIKSDASIEIRTNLTTRQKYIKEFVEKKSNWIRKKLEVIKNTKLTDETKFYLFGELYDKVDFEFESIEEFYKQKAKETIDPLVEKWSSIMKLYPTHIGYRNNKSRWGSCSGKNRIFFNTNLAKMHHDFIEYVVVHELAHIKHKNHSREFWKYVGEFLPDYKRRQNISLS